MGRLSCLHAPLALQAALSLSAAAPALALPSPPAPPAAANVLAERRQRVEPVWSSAGIVAAEERGAMAVGAAVLRQGDNAVDAAVATAFAMESPLPVPEG